MKRTILTAVLLAGTALISPASADFAPGTSGRLHSDHCDGGSTDRLVHVETTMASITRLSSIRIAHHALNGMALLGYGSHCRVIVQSGRHPRSVLGRFSGRRVHGATHLAVAGNPTAPCR